MLTPQLKIVTDTRTILSTVEEVRAAALQVATAATRLLAMYTQDLDPQIYDQPRFLEAIKRLVLARGYAKVRVLLADPARTSYESSRFIALARRITSHIEVRTVVPPLRDNPSAFLIADDRALVYRRQARSWDGIAEMNDPVVARLYLDHFDETWLASAPDAGTRQQHL
jgi:hypothetical protein